VVAINTFHGECAYGVEEVREALKLSATTLVVRCDARQRESSTLALVQLVRHVQARAQRLPRRPQRQPIG
jgi:signal recognition particle receptor subunit beta